MANVFKNKYYRRCKGDSWWWIRYRDADGKDKRERAAPTKREAEKLLAERVAAVNEGKKLPSKRDGAKLFSEFADEYLETHASTLAWERTVKMIVRHWRAHFGKSCRLRDISVRRIEAFRTKRLKAGVQKSTVNRNVAVLKRMLNVAIDWDLLSENPAVRVKQYRENGSSMRFLTRDEADRLLAECRASRNELLEPLVVLALNTGARKGELTGLRWADVDLDARTITFPKTKSGERRDMPVNDVVVKLLRRLKRRTGDAKHVFSRDGEHMRSFRAAWEAALDRAKIENFRFHDLRHTYASWATQGGVDVRQLQRLLGHKTLAMTMRYSHLGESHLRDAAEMVSFGG